MISHFAGNPHGPSLSLPVFSCAPDAAGAVAGAAGVVVAGAVVETGATPFVSFVRSVNTLSFFSALPSSHACALATAS
jgi:hypothetical protein